MYVSDQWRCEKSEAVEASLKSSGARVALYRRYFVFYDFEKINFCTLKDVK